MANPLPVAIVHVRPAVDDAQVKVPSPVAAPYGRTLVSTAGLPSSQELPSHGMKDPSGVMVTRSGGENDAHRTMLAGLSAIMQARFLVGERNVPLEAALARGRTATGVVVEVVVVPAPLVALIGLPGPVVVDEPDGPVG
jgi:hypothetical protein